MNVPLRLTLNVWSHSFKLVSSLAEFMLMPALLQATWMAPYFKTMVSIILWTSSGLLMSAVTEMALTPEKPQAFNKTPAIIYLLQDTKFLSDLTYSFCRNGKKSHHFDEERLVKYILSFTLLPSAGQTPSMTSPTTVNHKLGYTQ